MSICYCSLVNTKACENCTSNLVTEELIVIEDKSTFIEKR